jgi:Tat protein secretion system quality control protein TatD with DNase activity
MEQTAVEILVEGLIQECGLDDDGNMAKYIIQQAKEMFEQQIKDAYQTSHISMMTAEQYYNETFKQKP